MGVSKHMGLKKQKQREGQKWRYARTFFLPTMLCERKTSELWLAQSAEEALIKLDCTIGTLFSILV